MNPDELLLIFSHLSHLSNQKSPEERSHAYWLAEAPFTPASLETTRTDRGSMQEKSRRLEVS
jgi:hypothetical protein